MESEKKWYVIHTYSGYENKVKANLERKVHSMGMEDEIFNIVVPMEDEEVPMEDKEGRRTGQSRTVKKKVFPGYALVEMIVNDRSWYVVRNTPGVTGFVGSGTKPIPLSDTEVEKILHTSEGLPGSEEKAKKPRRVIDVEPGESIRINSGAFENFPATVTDVDKEKGKIKALVEMFGRDTQVELDFDQVEKFDK